MRGGPPTDIAGPVWTRFRIKQSAIDTEIRSGQLVR